MKSGVGGVPRTLPPLLLQPLQLQLKVVEGRRRRHPLRPRGRRVTGLGRGGAAAVQVHVARGQQVQGE